MVGWLLAQVQTANPEAVWATLVAQLGLSGVFLYLYQQERKERIRLQDQAAEIAKLAYPLLATVGKALENVERGLHGGRND